MPPALILLALSVLHDLPAIFVGFPLFPGLGIRVPSQRPLGNPVDAVPADNCTPGSSSLKDPLTERGGGS